MYEQLKFNLYQDDAVTGEAAGIAMGMVMLGSKSTQAIEDMVAVSKKIRFLSFYTFFFNNIALLTAGVRRLAVCGKVIASSGTVNEMNTS